MLILDLNGNSQLYLKGNTEEIERISKHRFFKLHVKGHVLEVSNESVLFKPNVYYKRVYLIIEKLKKATDKLGFDLIVKENVYDYINRVDSYINEKYTIGNDIKNEDPRLKEQYERFVSIVNDNMERRLREKQMKDAFYLSVIQKSGNFSVPGSGKTSTVYGAFAYLNQEKNVDKIIMIGPLNSFNSWIDEFQACFGDKKKLKVLNIKDYSFSDEKRMMLNYENKNKNLILLNYETLDSLEEAIKPLINENVLVVFDEVHRIKSTSGKRANAALRITEEAKYLVALTGTPIPNGYIDIYNLLNILYPYDYDHFFNFTEGLLKNPNQSEVKRINDKIYPFFTRTTKEELGVPLQNKDKIIEVNADRNEEDLLKILLSKYKSNMLALFAKISQMESVPSMLLENLDLKDFSRVLDVSVSEEELIEYQDFSEEIEDLVSKIRITSKMKALIQLVTQITSQSKTVIIWCIFVKSMNRIKHLLNDLDISAEIISGSVETEERNKIIQKFKNKEIDVLITNPHTLAESVSLHHTCHDAIYFEYSYNLVHLLQSKDRIHRLGLEENQYTQYYYLQQFYQMKNGSYSLDERVYNRLNEKERLMLEAIDNHELEILPTEDEDLQFFFNNVF